MNSKKAPETREVLTSDDANITSGTRGATESTLAKLPADQEAEPKLPDTLYRSSSESELFWLWKRRKLSPQTWIGHEDSDVPAGSVGSFWFAKPYSFPTPFCRPILLTLPSEKLNDPHTVLHSEMRYRFDIGVSWTDNYDPNADYRRGEHSVNEYFTGEELPLDDMGIELTDDYWPKYLQKDKEEYQRILKVIEGITFSYTFSYTDLDEDIIEKIQQDFLEGYRGGNLASDKIKILDITESDKASDLELDQLLGEIDGEEGWVNLTDLLYPPFIYIKLDELEIYLKQKIDFIEWVCALKVKPSRDFYCL